MSQKSCFFVGPRIQALAPLLAGHGWNSTGYASGAEAVEAAYAHPPDVVAFEIDLDDGLARVFVREVREQAESRIVLLEDPAKAHRIVSELTQGIEHYLPTPPDEEKLFALFDLLAGQAPVVNIDFDDDDDAGFENVALQASVQELQKRNLELQLSFDDARASREQIERDLSNALDAKLTLEKKVKKQSADIAALEVEVEQSTREIKMSSLVPSRAEDALVPGVSSPAFQAAVDALWPK